MQLIDTADFYGLGRNEKLLADALHPYSDGLVIATKVGAVRASPSDWTAVGRPEYLRQQAELCLRRLRLDRIDLLQLHRVDPLGRSPTSSARCDSCRTRARSVTSGCPT